jgi:hypothetical protein
MDPVTATLMALSAGGGIMSALGGRKQVSPEMLRQMFGPNAVNQEVLDLFNNVINSPYGQQLLSSAAEQGQQFQRDTESAAAKAGYGGAGTSGASIFSTAASGGAVNSLQRNVRSQTYAQMLPVAQQMVQDRMAAYLQQQQQPTKMQLLGQNVGNAAGTALAAYQSGKDATTSKPTGTVAPGTSAALTNTGFENAAMQAPTGLSAFTQSRMQSDLSGSPMGAWRTPARRRSRFAFLH